MNRCIICGEPIKKEDEICEKCELEAERENLVYYEFYVSTCPVGDIIEYVALSKNLTEDEINIEFNEWVWNAINAGYTKKNFKRRLL